MWPVCNGRVIERASFTAQHKACVCVRPLEVLWVSAEVKYMAMCGLPGLGVM
jgi:hypothetical protein